MKRLLPHIYIENCKEALDYYQKVFGGEIKNTQTGDGMEMFEGHEGKYIHSELHINKNCVIFFADVFNPLVKGENIWTMLDMTSEDEINSIYETLSKDGEVKMELQDTFWNSRFAVVKDKNGLTWELNFSK
ncbi:glyoxalase/bleomycin resistance/extradiol dioxygenase family protein [Bacillus sp. EAC]|uniref:VOC family protein n=1 Tax=Bacillus sp. EAC TaxID=1978338 RepID=UPI000B43B362|nr:VOC family protein [Bacillus sp. EAC]